MQAYKAKAWTFVSPIPVWFEIVQISKNGIKLNASIINYVHQTGINLYDATNIVKIPRPTNVFRGVMEQIYIKLDTQQGF